MLILEENVNQFFYLELDRVIKIELSAGSAASYFFCIAK